jgi:hypothetical protein
MKHSSNLRVANAKAETEELMNELIAFAKRMLSDHGEFHPFGAKMTEEGAIVHLGALQHDACPKAADLISALERGLREAARVGGIRAAGVAMNVTVTPPGVERATDAIDVRLDHQDNYAVEVFIPYVCREGAVHLGTPFSQAGSRFAFGSPLS